VDILASSSKPTLDVYAKSDKDDETKDSLVAVPLYGNLLVGNFNNIALPSKPIGEGAIKIFFEDKNFKDLWIVLTWSS
jgi:hypothetical protein